MCCFFKVNFFFEGFFVIYVKNIFGLFLLVNALDMFSYVVVKYSLDLVEKLYKFDFIGNYFINYLV